MVQPEAAQSELPQDLKGWKRDLKSLWLRVLLATNRAVALLIAILIHKGLDAAAVWIVPDGWEFFLTLFRGTFFVAFFIVYVHFLWEMLVTFVPAFGGRKPKKQPEVQNEGTPEAAQN